MSLSLCLSVSLSLCVVCCCGGRGGGGRGGRRTGEIIAHTGNTDLAILLKKDTFEPDPMVLAFREDSSSKGTWVWSY